jgi:GntR family transcriptional regulator
MNYLKQNISEGHLRPGDRIPTESTLSETLQVSRSTVRKALQELVTDGTIEHRPNKGHYAMRLGVHHSRTSVRSLFNVIEDNGYRPSSRILRVEHFPCPLTISNELRCSPGAELFFIERIRYADTFPLALESLYFPAKRLEGLDPQRLIHESLARIMTTEHGINIMYSNHRLEPVIPTTQEMELLELKSRDPQLLIHMTAIDQDGTAVKYAKILYLSDVVDYTFTWYSSQKGFARQPSAEREM